MTVKYISWPMVINYEKFGFDVRLARKRHRLTQKDADKLAGGYEGVCSVIENNGYERQQVNISMSALLDFCNLFDLDPRSYFELKVP